MIHDELARYCLGHFCAMINFDARKHQVNTSSHASRRPDRPVVDEDPIRIDRHFRVSILQSLRKLPVRRRSFAIQITRSGKQKCACTNTRNA
ncbi:hypothetical protein ASE75_02975 [Sphingomonas sp. Leaf17]|nr:hypothetical protein ASE75_02975 [Sphingomonas sp. Leaf17]